MELRLTELEPYFLHLEKKERVIERYVSSIAEADGIQFLCPHCFIENQRQRPGVHSVLCWKPGIPLDISPSPGRWELLGTGFSDLTLRAGSSSVQLTGGCNAHFFITNGLITFAGPIPKGWQV